MHKESSLQIEEKFTTLDLSGGDIWKNLRKNLSPTFTSGKLKGMMEPMSEVADDMMAFIEKELTRGNGTVDMKEIFNGNIDI